MSRSNSSEQGVSPAKKTFEWSSENGQFKYYDKVKKESQLVDLPFRFIVLDKLSAIKGFSDSDKSGIWSNDVKDIRKKLIVRTKTGIMAEGLYSDIKDKIAAQGARYATQLYVGYYEEQELTIGLVTLVGASNSAFIDFQKDNNIYKGAIQVSDYTDAKKGATKYKIPNFSKLEITEDSEQKSIELDKIVQAYLAGYFATYNQPPAQKTEQGTPAPASTNIKANQTSASGDTNDWSDMLEPSEKDIQDPPF